MGLTKTKIDWCDFSWNPVWGCLNDCDFCYARKIAKRFGESIYKKEVKFRKKENEDILRKLKDFKPVFLFSQLNREFPSKPSRIFVNSMSDIAFWKIEWMEKVLKRIEKHNEKFKIKNLRFISFEPLLFNEVLEKGFSLNVEWIIIGAQTNPVKPPKKEWVERLILKAKNDKIPVFTKENLDKIYPELSLKEFPE